MEKKVGQVSPEESAIIQKLYERRNGLVELAKIIDPSNEALYEKLVADMGKTSTDFQQWWSDMAAKYEWESLPDHSWRIDFNTGDIFLQPDD